MRLLFLLGLILLTSCSSTASIDGKYSGTQLINDVQSSVFATISGGATSMDITPRGQIGIPINLTCNLVGQTLTCTSNVLNILVTYTGKADGKTYQGTTSDSAGGSGVFSFSK